MQTLQKEVYIGTQGYGEGERRHNPRILEISGRP